MNDKTLKVRLHRAGFLFVVGALLFWGSYAAITHVDSLRFNSMVSTWWAGVSGILGVAGLGMTGCAVLMVGEWLWDFQGDPKQKGSNRELRRKD